MTNNIIIFCKEKKNSIFKIKLKSYNKGFFGYSNIYKS